MGLSLVFLTERAGAGRRIIWQYPAKTAGVEEAATFPGYHNETYV